VRLGAAGSALGTARRATRALGWGAEAAAGALLGLESRPGWGCTWAAWGWAGQAVEEKSSWAEGGKGRACWLQGEGRWPGGPGWRAGLARRGREGWAFFLFSPIFFIFSSLFYLFLFI
jgi:hypothetical protein